MKRGLLARLFGYSRRAGPIAMWAAAIALVPTLSFAQATRSFGFGRTSGSEVFAVPHVTAVGMPFTPLSASQMSRAAAGGLPSNTPSIVTPNQGPGPVLLWDEIAPAQQSTRGSEAGSLSFSTGK